MRWPGPDSAPTARPCGTRPPVSHRSSPSRPPTPGKLRTAFWRYGRRSSCNRGTREMRSPSHSRSSARRSRSARVAHWRRPTTRSTVRTSSSESPRRPSTRSRLSRSIERSERHAGQQSSRRTSASARTQRGAGARRPSTTRTRVTSSSDSGTSRRRHSRARTSERFSSVEACTRRPRRCSRTPKPSFALPST